MQRFELIESLINKYGYSRGIEIGVKSGRTILHLLSRLPGLHMTAIDPWADQELLNQLDENGEHKSYEGAGWRHKEFEAKFRNHGRPYVDEGRLKILKGYSYSPEVLQKVKDNSVDFVFIDGDHSYEGCKKDIELYLPKIKKGGLIIGHDVHWVGVNRAVRELLPTYKLSMQNNTWWCGALPSARAANIIRIDKWKTAFYLNAKVASTSIKQLLIKHVPGAKMGKDFFAGLGLDDPENIPSDYLKIAVVRNPWARLVSCYFDKAKNGRPHFTLAGLKPGATFDEFVCFVANMPDETSDIHFRSQGWAFWDAIKDDPNALIVKSEALHYAWTDIVERVKAHCGVELPALEQQRTTDHDHYSKYYIDWTMMIIADRYRQDIEAFGYEF